MNASILHCRLGIDRRAARQLALKRLGLNDLEQSMQEAQTSDQAYPGNDIEIVSLDPGLAVPVISVSLVSLAINEASLILENICEAITIPLKCKVCGYKDHLILTTMIATPLEGNKLNNKVQVGFHERMTPDLIVQYFGSNFNILVIQY